MHMHDLSIIVPVIFGHDLQLVGGSEACLYTNMQQDNRI